MENVITCYHTYVSLQSPDWESEPTVGLACNEMSLSEQIIRCLTL